MPWICSLKPNRQKGTQGKVYKVTWASCALGVTQPPKSLWSQNPLKHTKKTSCHPHSLFKIRKDHQDHQAQPSAYHYHARWPQPSKEIRKKKKVLWSLDVPSPAPIERAQPPAQDISEVTVVKWMKMNGVNPELIPPMGLEGLKQSARG